MGVLKLFRELLAAGVDKDIASFYASGAANHRPEAMASGALTAQNARNQGAKVDVGEKAIYTSLDRKRKK